jgi:tetratricopeptide (TPR) repeat protein
MSSIRILPAMWSWLWPFGKKKEINPDEQIREHWKTHFRSAKKSRFESESGQGYRSYYGKASDLSSYILEFTQKNLFAWSVDPVYLYDDFVLELDFSFPGPGYVSAGIIFRHSSDQDFYSILLSSKNQIRFDVIRNSSPEALLPWTDAPKPLNRINNLKICARRDLFSLYMNGDWVVDIKDETFIRGKIALAGQNYEESAQGSVAFHNLQIESRPGRVEEMHDQLLTEMPAAPEQLSRLAHQYFRQGQFQKSAVNFKRAISLDPANNSMKQGFAESLLALGMYTDAEKLLKSLIDAAGNTTAMEILAEYGNILYLTGRYPECIDFYAQHSQLAEIFPSTGNILGHAFNELGRFSEAHTSYKQAALADTDNPWYALHTARSAEALEDEEASEWYVEAALRFYKQENFDEMAGIISRYEKLYPDSKELIGLKMRYFFSLENFEELTLAMEELAEKDPDFIQKDPDLLFLQGIVYKLKEEYEGAARAFQNAISIDPDQYLYWFHLADVQDSLGEDSQVIDVSVNKALELNDQFPWTWNLKAALAYEKQDFETAQDCWETAFSLNPNELDLRVNLSNILFENGKKEDAYSLLEEDNPIQHNQRANLYTRDRLQDEAVREYEKAVLLDPIKPEYRINLALACLEIDMISRAEEVTLELMDIDQSPEVYLLISRISLRKGETLRADAALTEGLEQFPQNIMLRLEQVETMLFRAKYEAAEKIIAELQFRTDLSSDERDQLDILWKRLEQKTTEELQCANCGQSWRVPIHLGPQPGLRINGEPPGWAPAGASPETGKIYCINCAQEHMRESRFVCPESDEYLKLSDPRLRFLLMKAVNSELGQST